MATVCIAHLLFGVDDPVEGLAPRARRAPSAGRVAGVLDVLVALGIRTAGPAGDTKKYCLCKTSRYETSTGIC